MSELVVIPTAPPEPGRGTLIRGTSIDPADIVALAVGLASLAAHTAADLFERTRPGTAVAIRPGRSSVPLLDAALGASALVADTGSQVVGRVGGLVGTVSRPLLRAALRPPLLPPAWQPATVIDELTRRSLAERDRSAAAAKEFLAVAVPAVLDAILDQLDLDRIVLDRVDLDAIVATVDVDAIAARVDVDAIAARVDVDAIAASVDIDDILRRVDTGEVAAIAQNVLEDIDLPDIIRESSGSMASESIRSLRLQSIAADDAVARLVDRLTLRRKGRSVNVPDAASSQDRS